MMTRFTVLLAYIALFATQVPSPAPAQDIQPPGDWCVLDAPGLYRALREEARAEGRGSPGDCPVGGDPAKAPKRLVIPLPCERHLDLVRVDVPVSGILDHLQVTVGGAPEQADTLTRYIQGAHEATIAGAFSLTDDGPATAYEDLARRAYWIGSHEWTAVQHALVTSGSLRASAEGTDTTAACTQVNQMADGLRSASVPPAAGLSWYDTQAALRDLNAHVIALSQRRMEMGAAPVVPWEQGSTGFFRLPSEAEWEFAARGGLGGAASSGPLHATRDDKTGIVRIPAVEEIARVGAGRGETLSGVGGRAANLIGLYDVIGNASELTHDLFGLVRPDAEHGAKGGAILRGGNALTPTSVIGVPHRQELVPFTASGEARSPLGGMRVLLAAPVISRGYDPRGGRAPDLPNPELGRAMDAGHVALTTVGATAGASFRGEARTLLAQLQVDLGTGNAAETIERVGRVTEALEQSEAAINTAQAAEIRARVRSAVDSILLIRNISAISLVWLKDLEQARAEVERITDDRRPALEERIAAAFANVDRRIAVIDVQVAELQNTLRVLARADSALVREAQSEIADGLRAAGIDLYDDWAWPLYAEAMDLVRGDPAADLSADLTRRLDIFATERAEKYGR